MRTPCQKHAPVLLALLALLAACGAAGEPPDDLDVDALARPLTAVNGQTQNGQTQNGQTQNGTTYGVAGADLGTARKLRAAPPAGADPDLSAPTDPISGAWLDGTLLRAGRASGAYFVNTLISATMSDGTAGTLWIKAVQAPAAGADPDLWHYTIRVLHRDIGQPWGWLCRSFGLNCPLRWDPACGYLLRSRIEVKATALAGQWNYDRGYAGAGGKVIRSDHPSYTRLVTFACDGGAISKCVKAMGYKPWRLAQAECADGHCYQQTMESMHEACVRMVRADYCGDGQDHTLNGIMLDVWDNGGRNAETPYSGDPAAWGAVPPTGLPYGYEAEWTPRGARCVSQMLMPRTSHQGATGTVQQYLEGRPYCSSLWGPGHVWSSGDCFGRGPQSQRSTFSFANVPWDAATGRPAMDLRSRVYLRNSSVCIDDANIISAPHDHSPNPLKTSAEWAGRCLPGP